MKMKPRWIFILSCALSGGSYQTLLKAPSCVSVCLTVRMNQSVTSSN